jgi:hypothetical protein
MLQDFIAVFPDQIASKTPVKYDDKFTKILKATELKFAEKQTRSGPRVRLSCFRWCERFALTHLDALHLLLTGVQRVQEIERNVCGWREQGHIVALQDDRGSTMH